MGMSVPVAFANALMRFTQQRLALKMRCNLVTHMQKYMLNDKNTFYRMHSLGSGLLSTLDQRVTQDLDTWAESFTQVRALVLVLLVVVVVLLLLLLLLVLVVPPPPLLLGPS